MKLSRNPLSGLSVLGLVIAATALAGCGSSSSKSSSNSSKGPITFAGIYGPPASGGASVVHGMQVAAYQLNQSGGIDGRHVKILGVSTDGTPEGVAAAYQQLGSNSSVLAASTGFIGTPGVRGLSNTAQLPVISASGDDAIEQPAIKYVFSNSYAGEYATSGLVHAVDVDHAKTIGIMHYNAPFSLTITPAIEKRCKQLGCKVVSVQQGLPTDSVAQLEPALTKLKAANPDVYYIEGMNPNGFKAARALGMFNKPVISDNWLSNPTLALGCGSACAGVWFSQAKIDLTNLNQLLPNDPEKPLAAKYRAEFSKVFPGQPFDSYSTYGYDEVMAFAFAAKWAVSNGQAISRSSIADGMNQFHNKNFLAITGYFNSSAANHRVVSPDFSVGYAGTVFTVQGGKVVYSLAPNTPRAGVGS